MWPWLPYWMAQFLHLKIVIRGEHFKCLYIFTYMYFWNLKNFIILEKQFGFIIDNTDKKKKVKSSRKEESTQR